MGGTWRVALVACLALGCHKQTLTSDAGPDAAIVDADVDSGPTRPPPPKVNADALAKDVSRANDFGFALYGELRRQKGNVFFSPTSIRNALGIAYLGANGATASEMAKAMHLDADAAASADVAHDELAMWSWAKGAASLAIANRLWTDSKFTPKAPFANAVLVAYGAPSEPVDFQHSPMAAKNSINAWIAERTNDKIPALLDDVDSKTRIIITNAIWFKGDWASAFATAGTQQQAFFVDGTTPTMVPMMHHTTYFGMAAAGGATMLELPYANSDFAMDVLLPGARTGLAAIENEVVTSGVTRWTSALSIDEVDVAFPKLTFRWKRSLVEPLEALGMKTAFKRKADFIGIGDPSPEGDRLQISDVLHQAFVAIDEQGTEASAATAVAIPMPTTSIHETPRFVADHPFIVLIRDVKQGRILFLGRVTDPTR